MLLNYKQLRSNLEYKDCIGKVMIVCYTIQDTNISIFGNLGSLEFLKNNNAQGYNGEIFIEENIIYCAVGQLNNDEFQEKDSWEIQRSMGAVWKKISQYYNKYEVEFNEWNRVSNCYYGFILASYKYVYLNKENQTAQIQLNLIINEKYRDIVEIAHSQNVARFLGDTPANLMTPTIFIEYAKDILQNYNDIEFRVLEENDIQKLGMNCLYSVGQGSKENTKLLALKYIGNKNVSIHKVAMVGKGVTFDSGGISLKPSLNMHQMRYDMMGAALMLMSFECACKLKLNINVSCTIPLVENLPSGSATKPGDVFIAMNKLSVEVGNTDAEGRLILADAIEYAQTQYNEKPEFLIDTATLTGAMLIALGNVYCGYFTNSNEFNTLIENAANDSEEYLWRLPLSKYYTNQLKSIIADINNIGGRMAGSITAAEFLHKFVANDIKWAHFDIAGLMDEGLISEIYGKGATGRPLPTFINILKKLQFNN